MFILWDKEADELLMERLKTAFCFPVYEEVPEDRKEELYLKLDREGLSLNQQDLSIISGFSGMKKRLKQSNLEHEILLKAVKIKGKQSLRILDATAGTGEDALLLASAGHRVDLFERDPVIAALLEDGLRKGLTDPDLKESVSRMSLFIGDSIPYMRKEGGHYDVIYLDPMFPKRTKSADVKKKFQLIHGLEKPCEDEKQLLMAAISATPLKIVIKRPVKGGYLADLKPDYSLSGKAVRYDVLNNLSRYKDHDTD